MSTIFQDLRYALRQLRRSPGFAVTAVLTLALGIGVTATGAGVARQVLLAPLPYPEPDRLVGVAFAWPGGPAGASEIGESYEFLARNSHSFATSTLINAVSATANLSDHGGHASSIAVLGVSQGYFDTLGTRPVFGRPFTAEEELPGGPHALVLSYGLWVQAFGSDPSILGRTLRLNQESVTVVGIMPDSLTKAMNGWFPASFVVRMAAHLDAAALSRRAVAAADPEIPLAKLTTMQQLIDSSIAAPRFFTQLASGFGSFSLLPTAVSLFGLLNYQVTQRTHEIGVRMALGASRERILRGVLVASGWLVIAGGTIGLLAALWLRPLLTHWIAASVIQSDSAESGVLFNRSAAILIAVACSQ